jgi:hypothetical protein
MPFNIRIDIVNALTMFTAVAFLPCLVTGQIDPTHKTRLIVYHQTQPQYQALGLTNQDTGDLNGACLANATGVLFFLRRRWSVL